MSNTLNSIGTLIAQRSLDLLVNNYPALSLVASDFSDAGANYGETVKTRVISPRTAIDYNGTTGYGAQDLTTSAVNVTLNKQKVSSFSLNAQELSTAKPQMIADYAHLVSTEIGDALYSDIAALFVTGNFANSTIAASSAWGFSGVINAANTSLSSRKVSKEGRLGIYNSSLYGALWNDDKITRQNFNNYLVGENKLPVVQGTVLTDYADLPTTSNLVGVQLHKSALAIATRLPDDVTKVAGTPQVSSVQNVIHPDLGIALQIRTWEDPKFGSVNVAATLMYGIAIGNSASAQLIRTA